MNFDLIPIDKLRELEENGLQSVDSFFRSVGIEFSLETMFCVFLLLVSVTMTMIYAILWRKSFGVYYTLLYAFMPITYIGLLMTSLATTEELALLSLKITYIGGCYLIFFMTMIIFDICGIEIHKAVKIPLIIYNTLIYLCVLTTEYTGLFYRGLSVAQKYGNNVVEKEYGPLHVLYVWTLVVYLLIGIMTVLYSLIFKKNVPKRRMVFLLLMELIITSLYLFSRKLGFVLGLDMGAYSLVLAQLCFLFIIRRISIYNVRDTSIDTITRHGEEGFISFDKKFKYLGCFGSADTVFPELKYERIDRKAKKSYFFSVHFLDMLEEHKRTGKSKDKHIERDGKIYKVEVHPLYNGKKMSGYQIHITDDTKDRKYIKLLARFNDRLQEKVAEKTRHIEVMHDNLVLSMATMVESRDNSTGGHIRRTSDCVRILLDEMKKDPSFGKNEKFCKDMIKAAPMHDLGKIAVPDAILQKPGRFTDEEFEKMKEHAAKGGDIVREILKETDDNEFKVLAENVARYHHERWDGSGYPEKISGDSIPYESRIMAIADVYDALVSKRVYKERMSFEKADSIIMEGMGVHFDPSLEKYYVAARPRLEQYYIDADEAETETEKKATEEAIVISEDAVVDKSTSNQAGETTVAKKTVDEKPVEEEKQ